MAAADLAFLAMGAGTSVERRGRGRVSNGSGGCWRTPPCAGRRGPGLPARGPGGSSPASMAIPRRPRRGPRRRSRGREGPQHGWAMGRPPSVMPSPVRTAAAFMPAGSDRAGGGDGPGCRGRAPRRRPPRGGDMTAPATGGTRAVATAAGRGREVRHVAEVVAPPK